MKTKNKRNSNKSPRGKSQKPHKYPYERIVRITEKWDGRTRVFFAIRDYALGYWRGTGELDEYDAWTRDLYKRATFDTRRDARGELAHIWAWRAEKEDEALEADRLLDSTSFDDDVLTDGELDEIDRLTADTAA